MKGRRQEVVDQKIEYHFLKTLEQKPKKSVPYLDTKISIKTMRNLLSVLRERMGPVERIKEYTIYKHWNKHLTILPDGSSFCNQVIRRPLEDKGLPNTDLKLPENMTILVELKEKIKLSNDVFPPEYVYDEVVDIIDMVFQWSDTIAIILSTKYKEEDDSDGALTVKGMGRTSKMEDLKSVWCEVYLSADPTTDVDELHELIQFLTDTMTN